MGRTTVKQAIAGMRAMAAAGLAVALFAVLLAFVGAGAVSAQEEPVAIQADTSAEDEATAQAKPSCETIELGVLDGELRAMGRWTTEECDSRFRANTDAHTYRFEVAETGRVRIDLMSSDADTYLYLLDGEENRITEIDDGSVGRLDSRIEREMQAGVYLVEATTTTDRTLGPADFEIAVSVVTTCDPLPLGTLMPGEGLKATGAWSSESCQSVFLTGHPSQYFVFDLPEGALVQIDLKSPTGDPVLIVAPLVALRTVVPGQVAHNDDVDGTRNSRILRYLPPDTYGIEATTYFGRDLQSPRNEFTLTVSIVEEEAHQARPSLKVEDIDIPAEVVAGDAFSVNYRVGNAGGNGFPDGAGYAWTYTVSRGVFQRSEELSSEHWLDHASFHTSDTTASPTSASTQALAPLSATFNTPGNTYLFTAVLAYDDNDNELSWHGLWHNLLVKSGPTYGPVEVEVNGVAYSVIAALDDDAEEAGTVITTVAAVDDPAVEVDAETQDKAVYTAGVRTQLLDGIFDRPGLEGLSHIEVEPLEDEDLSEVAAVSSPASSALILPYMDSLSSWMAGPKGRLADRGAFSSIDAERLVLNMGLDAAVEYKQIYASWHMLLDGIGSGQRLSFNEAVALQSRLAYAENVLGPAWTAAELIMAARQADLGWDDPEVQAMLSAQPGCDTGDDLLDSALALADIGDAESLKVIDTELRAALPAYAAAIDSVLCALENADAANYRFLERLGLGESEQLLALIEPESLPGTEPEEDEDATLQLRITARPDEDGRIEHGVELSRGLQILPEQRYLPTDAKVGVWHFSQNIELDGVSIGQIRARRLSDGRVEMGFRDHRGEIIVPDLAYLWVLREADSWYRSSVIEVPHPPEPAEHEEQAETNG